MTNRIDAVPIAILACVALSGCASSAETTSPPFSSSPTVAIATVDGTEITGTDTARHDGVLTVVDGCLTLDGDTLLVFVDNQVTWDGETLTWGGDEFRVGDEVVLTGGEGVSPDAPAVSIPPGCDGLEQWGVGEIRHAD